MTRGSAFARRILLSLAALLALGLAGCSYPLPFQPDTVPKLTLPGVRAGLIVEPFQGASDGQAFADALADALQEEDVAATADQQLPAPAYRMFGRAVPKSGSVDVQWGIEDAQGELVGGNERLLSADQATQWRTGDLAFYQGLAKTLASEVAASLAETRARTKDEFTVVVPAVAGAPGDGPRTLQRSMIYVLDKRGVKVTQNGDAPPEGTRPLTLRGVMTVTQVSGHSHIDMAWSLVRDDGTEVGKVEQANDLPPAMLQGSWGDIAFAIADSAADSVVDLVDHA
ncbi:MAG TPA: hypothetical protein VL966_17890, partial [Alphaproteobacteria bacterium]|nr:hypothetical protein [Alphaproteobacteria bacterium]